MTFAHLLRISRPRFWVYVVGPLLVAYAAADLKLTPAVVLLGLYATLPANLLIYGINDIFDRDTDALNVKKSGYERRLEAASVGYLLFWIVLLNVPILLALVFLLPSAAIPWLVLFLLTGVGYSTPPLRAKTKPFVDAACNILYVALGFAAYVALTHTQPPVIVVLAAACWCAAMHAYSAIPDISADRGAKLSTIATVLGGRGTILLCAGLYGLSALLSAPYLGYVAMIAGIGYGLIMVLSLRALQRQKLFAIYRFFPLINTLVGMGIWFWVALN